MPNWHNWSGKLASKPSKLLFPRSEEDVRAIVHQASRDGAKIRCAGATHSHAPLVQHDDIIMDLRGVAGITQIDHEAQTAWLGAGARLFTLGDELRRHGLALHNQGDIDEQAIAGATATGTHGTGLALKNLSSAVIGMRIVTAGGELLECNAHTNADIWRAARLHLGAYGVVTALQLQLRSAYKLQEQSWTIPLEEALEQSLDRIYQHRHFEFFWYPQGDEANIKVIDETDAPGVYPLAEEGARCAWNYEVLPNYRPHKHTEMEYSVPLDAGPDCLRDIQALLTQKFPEVRWPVEYRTLAADDVWLSSAYERDTITISVHEDVRVDERAYYQGCEEVFRAYDGRPHWGKLHYLNGEDLASIHPRWQEWWQQRDALDPEDIFLNEHLRSLRTR
ncbi:MAG: D-arabinono-1,4-lactone oxidase [Pseudomonadota bacterium]